MVLVRRRRLTTRYTMREGNRIVKYGITDNPQRREGENLRAGLGAKMRKEGSNVSRESAGRWERRKIGDFERRTGRLPTGNKV